RVADRQGPRCGHPRLRQGARPRRESEAAAQAHPGPQRVPLMIVDVNVSLSRWPFRRLRGDELPELVSMLQARGVTQAWAGSFDALLHKDMAGVNERLAADCARHGK